MTTNYTKMIHGTHGRCERCKRRIHTIEPWCPRDCTPHMVSHHKVRYMAELMGFTFTLAICVIAAAVVVTW